MPTITEKIPTITESGTENIENEILSFGAVLLRRDEAAYARVITELAAKLSPLAKSELSETLRTPELNIRHF